MSDDALAGPLAGITVLAVEQAVAAPFATRQLADLGARVIKVERPGAGDFARTYDGTVHGLSSYFAWLNRGKQSLTVDLKEPADLALVESIVEHSDVFIQNLGPGAAERLGLGPAALRDRHPSLIVCSISGYGPDGPYRDKKAYDLLVQCEAGLLSLTGDDEPAKAGISVADIAAGMYAYTGILTALYQRERTGRGALVEVSMLEALGEWMSQPSLFTRHGGRAPRRNGARHASIAPYGPYRTGGGGTVFLGIQNDREWSSFCTRVLGAPELVDDPRFATNVARVEHDAELTGLIEANFRDRTAAEVMSILDSLGIANAQLRTMAEFNDHPQLAARDRWRDVATPGGVARSLLPPVRLDGRDAAMGPVPAVGEHDASLRSEFEPAQPSDA